MAQTISAAAQAALREGRLAEPIAEVWQDGVKKVSLSLTEGEVVYDRTAAIPRSCTVSLAGFEAIIPEAGQLVYAAVYGETGGTYGGGDPLTYGDNVNRQIRGLIIPAVSEVRLFWRFHLDAGTEDISLGRYKVSTVGFEHSAEGVVANISGYDVSRQVALAGYVSPYTVPRLTNVATALTNLLTSKVAGITLTIPTTTHVTPRLTFLALEGANPWSDAQRIAYSAGWDLMTDRVGGVVAAPAPDPGTGTAAWTVTEAALVRAATVLDDEQAVNTVIVWGETAEDQPVSGMAEMLNGQWGVNTIGRRVRYFSLETVRTAEQATLTANGLLRALSGLTDTVEVETPPLPHLDPGDLVDVTDRTLNLEDTTYLLERVTLNVNPTRPTRLMLSRRLA